MRTGDKIGVSAVTNEPYLFKSAKLNVTNRLSVAKSLLGLFDNRNQQLHMLFSVGGKKIYGPPIRSVEIEPCSMFISATTEPIKVTTISFEIDGMLLVTADLTILGRMKYVYPEKYKLGQLMRGEISFFINI